MAAELEELCRPPRPLSPPGYSPEITAEGSASLELVAFKDPAASDAYSTYVVQVPREQIYRVPPPENERIAALYRSQTKARQGTSPCLVCLKWTLAAALLVGAVAGISSAIYFAIVRPATPQFTVESLAFKNSATTKKHPAKPEYDFAMTVRNPSNRMGFAYGSGGRATVTHNGAQFAAGATPEFEQSYKKTTRFKLVLRGTKASMLKLAGKGKKKSKKPLRLVVTAKFPAIPVVAGMKQGTKSLKVTCKVQVIGLMEKKARVTSEECKSKLESL